MTLSIPPLAPARSKDAVAPTQAAWDRMTPAEREAAVASLPTWVDIEECGAVEGEEHQEARRIVGETLRPHFAEADPSMYVTGEILHEYARPSPSPIRSARKRWRIFMERSPPAVDKFAWLSTILAAVRSHFE